MCCRACPGYDFCQKKDKTKDDCCPQCPYFDSCMEDSRAIDHRQRRSTLRRTPKG
ncbi:MAG: hypothetical protein ACUVUD_04550 [bacterium]